MGVEQRKGARDTKRIYGRTDRQMSDRRADVSTAGEFIVPKEIQEKEVVLPQVEVMDPEKAARITRDRALGAKIAEGRELFAEAQAKGEIPEGYEGEIWGEEAIAARNELVLAYDHLVDKASYRLRNKGIDRGDLEQHGRIVLMRRAEQFDPDIVPEFGGYANIYVQMELRKLIQRTRGVVHMPRTALDMIPRYMRLKEEREQSEGRTVKPEELAEVLARESYEKEYGVPPTDAQLAREMKSTRRILTIIEQGEHVDSLDYAYPDFEDEQADFTLEARLGTNEDVAAMGTDRELLHEVIAVINDGQTLTAKERIALLLSLSGDMTQEQIGLHEDIGVTQMQVSRLLSRAHKKLRDKLGIDAQV